MPSSLPGLQLTSFRYLCGFSCPYLPSAGGSHLCCQSQLLAPLFIPLCVEAALAKAFGGLHCRTNPRDFFPSVCSRLTAKEQLSEP